MNEWELMMVAEDIEEGDTVLIENTVGSSLLAVYCGRTGKFTLKVVDSDKVERKFKTTTLEEIGGNHYIVGKSKEALNLSLTREVDIGEKVTN